MWSRQFAGGTDAVSLSAKLANSIGRSNALQKTYAPVEIEAVHKADAARLEGRRKFRLRLGAKFRLLTLSVRGAHLTRSRRSVTASCGRSTARGITYTSKQAAAPSPVIFRDIFTSTFVIVGRKSRGEHIFLIALVRCRLRDKTRRKT